jgi:hypothetical protein
VNKCDWMPNLALFSQFVPCLGRTLHHSPNWLAGKPQTAHVPAGNEGSLGRFRAGAYESRRTACAEARNSLVKKGGV